MRFYRVHWWNATAGDPKTNGHPLYVHDRQGSGRIDNPAEYRALYIADSAPGAVGEALGNHRIWTDDLFNSSPSFLPGAVRAISEYEGSPSLVNLDDANELVNQGLKPSRVVSRNRSHTQAWALQIFAAASAEGVGWWSFYDPEWQSIGMWDRSPLKVTSTVALNNAHPAVINAARVLNRKRMP